MQTFLILFREPDGRLDDHSAEDITAHQNNWKTWLAKWGERLSGGNSLTLNGKMIKGRDAIVVDDIHKVGTEIVGGFLLLKAENLDEAVAITRSCPIFEFDGYAEVREMRN